ncbi:Pectinesterase, catalytic [Dillenia turbinata]|uniref:Pectinesterase n=1 Tax=Dillenia turbinata TaxID=194707 RepID=A0AAN8VHU2_9MAGN
MAEKKKIAILGVSSLVLVAMVVGAVVGIRGTGKSSDSGSGSGSQISTSNKAVESICQPTDFKETCIDELSAAAGNETDPQALIKAAFQVTIKEIEEAVKNSSTLKELAKDSRSSQALENCHELMEYAIDDLTSSFERLGSFEMSKLDDYIADIKVWLSAAITYQTTCLDGFENTTSSAGEEMKKLLKLSGEMTRNGLAIVTEFSTVLSSLNIPGFSRRLFSVDADGFPTWINPAQRSLLQATPATIKPNVVVAQDGTGKYKTINEALKEVPVNGTTPFVIHVKAGIYREHVTIGKWMTYVTLIGDGPTKTKITGNKNYVDGATLFRSDTVEIIAMAHEEII